MTPTPPGRSENGPISTRHATRTVGGALLVAAVLVPTACAPTAGEAGGPSADGSPATSTPLTQEQPSAPVLTRTFPYLHSKVEVGTSALGLDGDVARLRLDAEVTEGAPVDWADLVRPRSTTGSLGPGQPVRVLDLGRGQVHDVTEVSRISGEVDGSEALYVTVDAGELRDGDDVVVMIDSLGFLTDVPVEAGGVEVPDDLSTDDITRYVDSDDFVADLSLMQIAWNGASDTATDGERTELNLSSDVLFDVDSDQLRPDAQPVLEEAAAQLAQYEAGTISIVGHTDDVADDAHNQALSERRAASVRAALEGVVDLGAFDVEVAGRGESEPRVEGTSDRARQQNRRVEITVSGTRAQEDSAGMVLATGPLPPAKAVEAPGPQGIDVRTDAGGGLNLVLEDVTRVDDYVLGELRATITEGDPTVVSALSVGPWGLPGQDGSLFSIPDNVMLLEGSTWLPAAQYVQPSTENDTSLVPKMGDFGTTTEVGDGIAVPVVWPDPGTDSVTVSSEYAEGREVAVFRLTDVPVSTDPLGES